MTNTKKSVKLENVVFYAMERAIKSYRQFAQRNLLTVNKDLTIDQWLILKTIDDNPEIMQRELANKVFKDYASITRIINLLVVKGYLQRFTNVADRRRHKLKLTTNGKLAQSESIPIIMRNREVALKGFSSEEIATLQSLLERVTENCQSNNSEKPIQ